MPLARIPQRDLEEVLAATRPLWEDVRGQRIFITGGTGFFGAWLLETLCHADSTLNLNVEAVVLTRDPERYADRMPHIAGHRAITLHAGDVASFVFPEGKFSHVLHAATDTDAKRQAERPQETFSTTVAGTQHVLDFAVSSGARRFLLTSSGAVYGKQPSDITHLDETSATAPDPLQLSSVYGEGKRISEMMCALYNRQFGIECSIARCWAFVGPHLPLDAHFAVGNFIRDVMSGSPIRIGGDGTPTRSYLYAGDLAAWLWTMLFRGQNMQAYNVGSGDSVTIHQLAEAVRDTLNPSHVIEVAKQPTAGAPVSRYVPSVTKIERDLGLRVTVPLSEAIRRTASWYGWKGQEKSAHA